MADLPSEASQLAIRAAQECRALRVLINGNAVDLAALNTTAKTSLVAAINELVASGGGGGGTTLTNYSQIAGLTGYPTSFPPTAHAPSHAAGEPDQITPAAIGALSANNPSATGNLTFTANGHTITDQTPGLLGGDYIHTRPEASGYTALTGSATGVPDKLAGGTISGLTTVENGATWSYFSSVQSDAHLSAMGGGTAGIAVLKATTAAAAATAAGVGAGNSPTFGKILIGGSTGYGGSMIEPVGFGGAGLRWASSTMSLHFNSTGAGIGAASPGVTVGPILKFGTSVWNDLDVALSRNAAGVLEINNGTAGAFRDLKLRSILPDRTDTAAGTTGAATINKAAGSVNLASAATSLVVTNSLVTAASRVMVTVNANDTTCKSCAAVSAAGSFTIYPDAAPTAETNVSFIVLS